jgi:hypothetical protein
MVNEACNLRCPYCFAEEFVNKNPKEMSIDDFRIALAFALSDKDERQVGIIGGEPLLYSHIDEAMRMALDDPRIEYVMIYTNAVHLDRLAPDILENPKFRMLVNFNSPEDMGTAAFEKMCDNLMWFASEHGGTRRFRLSVNLYEPDFDYSYVFPIVEEIDFDVVRLSISVPQKGDLKGKTPLEYFHEMKLVAMRFVCDMARYNMITGFDCNFLPECVLTEQEIESVMPVKEVFHDVLSGMYSDMFWDRAIVCEIHNCSPVIDILPDLKAIRCFGLSEYTKQDIRDFRSINALAEYYIHTVDRPACGIASSPECENCSSCINGNCSGGCLLFKAEKLFKM